MPDDAQIGRFPRNPFLVPRRRRDLSSAIRRACDLLGRDPAMIPANVAELKRGLAQVSPVAMGCTPKTLQNIK